MKKMIEILFIVSIIFISGCVGWKCEVDGVCEPDEYGHCQDCPVCLDWNNCTIDYFDYDIQECVNKPKEGAMLFYDDFSTADNWELSDAYDVLFEFDKSVLRNSGSGDNAVPVLKYNFDKRNYIVEFSAKVDDLAGILSVRYDLSKNYSEKYAMLFGVVPEGLPEELPYEVQLLEDYEGKGIVGIGKSGGVGLLTVHEVPVKIGEWHDYTMILKENMIEVYVDGILYENYTDTDSVMQNGGVIFEGLGPRSTFSVDYVRVIEIC